jgi:Protein of unknown function (DUF1592)/Protein of unknown function (DUF1588)/Protein of unknown function (DUF1585)/Protein of unknown function (DUF1587)/Protein of unknown function (DUF1595)
MTRFTGFLLGLGCVALGWADTPVVQPDGASKSAQLAGTIKRYCVTCHNEKLRTGAVVLSTLNFDKVGDDAAIWEKVIRKLRTRAMPPPGLPRPDSATYDSIVNHLGAELDAAAAAHPNLGSPAIHRLNRTEYANVIRDLLGLDIDSEALLPADDSDKGFDNIGAALTVSPLLLERYVSAAEDISRLAIGDLSMRPGVDAYDVPKMLGQDGRMGEDLPFGSRGGTSFKHYFPVDGDYRVKVRMRRQFDDYIIGLDRPHQIRVWLDGESLKQFTVGGEHNGKSGPIFSGSIRVLDRDPRYAAAAKALYGEPAQEAYEHGADGGLEVQFHASAGAHTVAVTFLDDPHEPEGVYHPDPTRDELRQFKGGEPGIDSVSVGGPYKAQGLGDTLSRRKIFVCYPKRAEEEEPCARNILTVLARRAYRRPVSEAQAATLISFYRKGRGDNGFEAGIGLALQRMLVDSEFLFRMERDAENSTTAPVYRISDLDLASRLSFFLWSSIPDDELLNLAIAGKLKDPAVLERQVRRMLTDDRSNALVKNFFGQWLYLRNMRSIAPDAQVFPDFDENLRRGFEEETDLFLGSMLREDHGVPELLNANYTFVNERLARHYGIPDIYGSRFRRVTLPDDNRRGLLGQGSILTVTSFVNRTSPTIRGKWLLENLLGVPIPPPPPGVNTDLEDHDQSGKVLTVREQMTRHRNNPVCASCHAQMDPLGFALENFNAIGAWRSAEANQPIDASGVLPNGAKFQGPAELRSILLSQPEQFVQTVTEKLFTYALGRGLEYYDEPAVRKIVREAARNDYRWSALILNIISSPQFKMRSRTQS